MNKSRATNRCYRELKSIATILVLMIVSNCYSQNDAFWFPKDLQIDPLDYKFNQLQIDQIEIYQLDTLRYKNRNGIDTIVPTINMRFLIAYDTLNKIKAINYNFRRHYDYEVMPDNKTMAFNIITDSNLFHQLITKESDTIMFSSWRNEYYYLESMLDKIEIKKPARVEEGVFIQERVFENTYTCINTVNGNGLIVEEKYFKNEELSCTIKFEYELFENNSHSIQLLTKIIRINEDDKWISNTIINYSL